MMREMLTSAAVAIASLACVASSNLAHAATPAEPAGISVQTAAQHPLQLAQAVTSQSTTTKKTRRMKIEHPQTNWLNPQPEPPLPANKKPIQGGTWLNPQPEPPRPDTTKKLQ